MTKSELIKNICLEYPQLSSRDVEMATRLILEYLSDALADDERIEIRGFGSFSMHVRPAKLGRNPKTGEPVMVPEKRVPHFKAGKELREQVDWAADGLQGATGS
ncbi:integration host factor subunit beta [Acidithiobacillus sulfuriphilus]|jgi:integration host factor subunit beta|uniref:Integration host factor subunit beta n=2 Tax=Acidithiobacillus sulfuriphilus TaxID=1867749 RepID=A0A3M8QT26_9PROT|nr:integration host factor subunit beta [Acidithiobacillus sulfuriphilus]MCL5980094.1 integration host factor subunit beta [Gammaproteobacteria bacterium]RNF59395.1 integration host factor subunit beta [Acidithiobacillus sulfuriphilus]